MPNPRPFVCRLVARSEPRLFLAGLVLAAVTAGAYRGLSDATRASPHSGVLFANVAPDAVRKLMGASAPLTQAPLLLDPSTWATPAFEAATAAPGEAGDGAAVPPGEPGANRETVGQAPDRPAPPEPPPLPQPLAAPVAAARPAAPAASVAMAALPPASISLSATEQQVFDGQNAERAKAGLAPLRLDAGLEAVARRRAQDMAERGYFSHTSPSGETAFTLIAAAGVDAPYAGENIGYNTYPDVTSAAAILSGFLGSAPHRQNILDPRYTRVGVASAVGANGTRYYAVVFAGP
jgi:uncharacterized protein YkwD